MCGFICSYGENIGSTDELLKTIWHRGPDSSRTEKVAKWSMGFTRLSIVGASDIYDHPYTEDRRKYLMFNGEIYNYKYLASVYLKDKKPESDTKVLYALLEIYGEWILGKLDGIFAFVYIDTKEDVAILARDYFGVKPIYYYEEKNGIHLASEILPLRRLKGTDMLDEEQLVRYLSVGSCKSDKTIYRDIKQIEAGSTVKIKKGEVVCMKKYKLDYKFHESNDPVKESIEAQSPEIEFGVMYSGGIDSSILLKYTAKNEKLRYLFSIAVDDKEMDESYWQDMGIDVLSRKHIESKRIISNKKKFRPEELKKYSEGLDMPITHPSFIGALDISRMANRCGLKVLMCGEGADELYHGYKWHLSNDDKNNPHKIVCYAEPCHIRGLLGISTKDANEALDIASNIDEIFIKDYLPRWLNRADITGMRHSIENRVPFLSIKNLTYTKKMTAEEKTNNNKETKHILKKHLRNILPDGFIDRRKRGFDYPLNDWCLPVLTDFLEEQECIDKKYLAALINEYNEKSSYYIPRAIFVVTCYIIWKEINDITEDSKIN